MRCEIGIAHRHTAKRSGQLRQVVANLVCMREERQGIGRALSINCLAERSSSRPECNPSAVRFRRRTPGSSSSRRRSRRDRQGPIPATAAAAGTPISSAIRCAAARVSKDARFQRPARCSKTARTLIGPAPRISTSRPASRRRLWDCLRRSEFACSVPEKRFDRGRCRIGPPARPTPRRSCA